VPVRYDHARRMTQRDARVHARYAAEVDGTMRMQGREVRIRTRNVSRGGLCFVVDHEVPRGIDVDLELALRFEEGSFSESIKLRARVVWCTLLEKGHWQVGTSFFAVTGETRRWLDVFVKYLQAPRKARPETEEEE